MAFARIPEDPVGGATSLDLGQDSGEKGKGSLQCTHRTFGQRYPLNTCMSHQHQYSRIIVHRRHSTASKSKKRAADVLTGENGCSAFQRAILAVEMAHLNGARKPQGFTSGSRLAGEAPNYVTISDAGTGWNAQSLRLKNGN